MTLSRSLAAVLAQRSEFQAAGPSWLKLKFWTKRAASS